MRKFLVAISSVTFLLSGCSTTKFSCPYGEACADISDIYGHSLQDNNPKGWSVTKDPYIEKKGVDQDDFEDFTNTDDTPDKKQRVIVKKKTLKIKQFDALQGAVYHPAKPYQIWLAPWIDSSHILHSGSYAWFTTPAYWTYGGTAVSSANRRGNDGSLLSQEFDIQPYYKEGLAPASNDSVLGGLNTIAQGLKGE